MNGRGGLRTDCEKPNTSSSQATLGHVFCAWPTREGALEDGKLDGETFELMLLHVAWQCSCAGLYRTPHRRVAPQGTTVVEPQALYILLE